MSLLQLGAPAGTRLIRRCQTNIHFILPRWPGKIAAGCSLAGYILSRFGKIAAQRHRDRNLGWARLSSSSREKLTQRAKFKQTRISFLACFFCAAPAVERREKYYCGPVYELWNMTFNHRFFFLGLMGLSYFKPVLAVSLSKQQVISVEGYSFCC